MEQLQRGAWVILVLGLTAQVMAFAGSGERTNQLGHHLETCFLLAMFYVLAPLISTALYFVWFHAWRHIGRLCRWQSPDAPATLFACIASIGRRCLAGWER